MASELHSEGSNPLNENVVAPSRLRFWAPASRNPGSCGDDRKGIASQAAIEGLCINTIRTLAMDAVQQANSGHPGTPMALAPLIYTLWQDFLHFDPDDPIWPNRDR